MCVVSMIFPCHICQEFGHVEDKDFAQITQFTAVPARRSAAVPIGSPLSSWVLPPLETSAACPGSTCIHVISVVCPWFINVISMLYPCNDYGMSILYQCYIHVISMIYLWYVHVISMLYPWCIDVVSMLHLCSMYVVCTLA